jgi:hypothetical protein
MLHSHTEFQIVTPRTLEKFGGEILILPDVKCVSENEVNYLKSFLEKGNGVVITGETGYYDITGARVSENPIQKMLDLMDINSKHISTGKQKYIYSPECPGKLYSDLCKYEFDISAWKGNDEKTSFKNFRDNFFNEVNNHFAYQSQITIEASSFLSTQITSVEKKPHVFMANYKGLKSDKNAKQISEKNVKIKFLNVNRRKVFYLPYLGEKVELDVEIEDGALTCIVPIIDKGGVVWVDN